VNGTNFDIIIEEAINIEHKDDEQSLMSKINKKLEKIIIKNPGQWIWTHDRWRI